ncbi:RNA 2',3'-cyclic phosphodiesterase [Erythrobacter mangrovi]|uniref:RNA 2',3'-cyclic phosphodiesterase n=1 Tax=Erythrobacter mangrovi TaxID=2739433 RepID=A0A7D3XWG9_9SPHN|nr:RNA 2',3'-cyclic phosphodiesterase [Erythrobacter mangrovi]QKG71896.1 RNA 2',3'-cyclic phosphodiesterase [Erythrobacter mangrovi]
MQHRLFVGLRPPPAIRAALIGEMYGVDGARWQDDAQLHLTLRYIGEVDGRTAEDLARELGRITAPAFTLQLRGTGAFTKKDQPHTLWAGTGACDALDRLQHKVERASQAAGIAQEPRKFVPHVTLARLNSRSGSPIAFLQRTAGLQLDEWAVEEFTLFESHLRPEGSLYEPVIRYALDAAG